MARRRNKGQAERYEEIQEQIENRRLPPLTLDQQWHKLFGNRKPKEIKRIEEELNGYLKRQGAIRAELDQLDKLKKKLMSGIVQNMNAKEGSLGFKKMEKSRELIQEINDKAVLLENENLDLPDQIREANANLAFLSMQTFYSGISDELEKLVELERWIEKTREELRKKTEEYEQTAKRTQNVTAYFDRLLGERITRMYVNYMNGIYDDEE